MKKEKKNFVETLPTPIVVNNQINTLRIKKKKKHWIVRYVIANKSFFEEEDQKQKLKVKMYTVGLEINGKDDETLEDVSKKMHKLLKETNWEYLRK